MLNYGSRMTSRLALAFILASIAGSGQAQEAGDKRTYLFGIVPQQSATQLAKTWMPVIERMSRDTGLTIKFATTKDIPTFESCLAQGAYEFAYMNPYHYTIFHEVAGYKAFAHQTDGLLQGVVVVRKDSPAKTLKDLSGQTFAFPSPSAFGASILPRAEMRNSGIEHTPFYVNSHESVYRSVAAGIHPAGAGISQTLAEAPESIRGDLRVIYETKAYTPHAFAALPGIPDNLVAQISKSLNKTADSAPELLQPTGMKGIQVASDSQWDDIRSLNLTQEATQIVRGGDVLCRSD